MSVRLRTTDRELRVAWCKYQILLAGHHKMKTVYECRNELDIWEHVREEIESRRRIEISALKTKLTYL